MAGSAQKQPHPELRLQSLIAELQEEEGQGSGWEAAGGGIGAGRGGWETPRSAGVAVGSTSTQRKDQNDPSWEHKARGQSWGAGGPMGSRGTQALGLHLVLLARDVAPRIRRQLTLHLGRHRHLAALQLHHTLTVSGAILGAWGSVRSQA